MFKIKSLDHLVLTVKNIDKSVEFYTTVLGMERSFQRKQGCIEIWTSKDKSS